MKNKIAKIKLRILPGKASPAPPIGSTLGQKGINIMDFCKFFNSETKLLNSLLALPVLLILYSDKSYDVIIKKPTVICFLKEYLKINKFSNNNIFNLDYFKIKEIILFKLNDFNTNNFNSIFNIFLGILKSTGIKFYINFNEAI